MSRPRYRAMRVRLTRDLPGDYAQAAAAATGSTWAALLAVTAVIYAACLLASGLRARRRALREAAPPGLGDDESAEGALASAGRRR